MTTLIKYIKEYKDEIQTIMSILAIIIALVALWQGSTTNVNVKQELTTLRAEITESDKLIVKGSTNDSIFIPCKNDTYPEFRLYFGELHNDTIDGEFVNGSFLGCVKR